MSFPRDAYPYTNFHELNLGYFITHFREIFSQWADLYDQMLDWKDSTDEELTTWKAGVEADLDQREAALRAELETWKAQTGQDIAGWEDATLAALTAWQTATQAVFEAIRVEAAGSATAAAASAGDAATAKTAAEAAQAAAEAAAASVQASAAQITTNTEDIADLKTQISNLDGFVREKTIDNYTKNYQVTSGNSIQSSDYLSIDIPVGKKYEIEVIDNDNCIDDYYNFYVNGSYKNGNREPGIKYEYVADVPITRLSIYVPGSKMVNSGILVFSVNVITENENSLEKTVKDNTEDISSLTSSVSAVETILDNVTENVASKNIFDDSEIKNKSGVTFTNDIYSGTATDLSGHIMENVFESGKQYTISLYAYTDGNISTDGNGLYIGYTYSDGTLNREYFPNNTETFTKFTITSNASKNITDIIIGFVSAGSNIWHLKEIQVELGDEATTYVSPSGGKTAIDEVARTALENMLVRPWYSVFEKEFLKIAYSAIWVDKINTSAHWLFASDMGFNTLKGDVEITSDGKLIMCHDPGFTFDENGRIIAYDSNNNTPIVQMTYMECRSKVYADNPTRYGNYCPVADIDDFIKICKDKEKICFVTVRTTNTAAVVEELINKILYYGMESRTIINALSTTILDVVRANSKCNNVAINYVAPYETAITKEQVNKCATLGKCFISIWCNDTKSIIDNSSETIAHAKSKNVPLLAGSIGSISSWNYLINKGIMGSQIYKPIFDVEPKNYRFKVTISDGVATFGNLFTSDRFTGTATLVNNKLTVSDIYITDSYLSNVIDGIQPIKMNMLNPVIKCLDWDGLSIPIIWKDNAFEITLSNTNDNVYTVIVDV